MIATSDGKQGEKQLRQQGMNARQPHSRNALRGRQKPRTGSLVRGLVCP